ncbi:MAG: SRPBCC family protein [Chloroflexota bacterium]|nr:MAG: SRPBCC family protein [Chloroflexota bacterium]
MYQFEYSIFINRSPEDVFAFVTDPDNLAKWQGGRETFQWITEDPPGVGSRYRVHASILGRKIDGEMEVTDWEVPSQYTIRGSSGPLTSVYTRKFEAQGEGTLLTQISEVEIGGILKVLEGVAGRYTKRLFASVYPNLKQIMEADQETEV